MPSLHHVVIGFAREHALLACVFAGLLASLETLPVLGALVPGTATIVAISALVATGAIPFLPLVTAVALGAMIGDSVSYAIGRRYGPPLLTRWPLNRHPALVAKAEIAVARHGGKTLLVSRFTPGVRAIVPPLAGALGMRTSRFVPIIIAAGLIWAFAHVGLGFAIGAGLELLGAVAGRLAFVALVAGLLVWLSVRLALALARRLPPLIARVAAFLLAGLAHGDNRFSRRLARVLASPPRTISALVLMALLLALGAWGFATALALLRTPLPSGWDALATALSMLRTSWSDPVLRALAATGNRWVLAAIALAVLAGLVRRRRSPVLWVAGLLGATALDTTLGGGPAALEATLLGMLAYAAAYDLRAPWGRATAVPVVLIVILAGFSRVVLGLSLAAEEVAGIGFAIAWVGLAGVADILRQHEGDAIVAQVATPGRSSTAAAGALVVLAMALQVAGVALIVPPAPTDPTPRLVLEFDAWREGGWATLQAEQAPLLGKGSNPLVFQWVGSRDALAADLAGAGWQRPTPWSARAALDWLMPGYAAMDLPVLPHLYRGTPERMILVHEGASPDQRLVLRVWYSETEVRAPAGAHDVLVGTLSHETLHRSLGIVTLARAHHANEAELKRLAASLPASAWVVQKGPRKLGPSAGRAMLLAWPLALGDHP